MITREEYIKENEKRMRDFILNDREYSDPKFTCVNCQTGGMCKNLKIVCPTYPPKYKYKCNNCNYVDYLPF